MTVTTVRKIPSELPHAHLYLEDLEEICKILLDAFSRPSTSQPTILFSLGDDLQMDSIDDLERRGGSAKDFGIEVVGYSYDRIRFQSFMNPEADFYSLSDSGRWAMHNKLKAVFDARRFVIKNAILGFPELLRFSLAIVATWGVLFLLAYLHARWFILAYIVFLGLIAFVIFRSSRVSFVRSHDRFKQVSEVRRGYFRDVFVLIITNTPQDYERQLHGQRLCQTPAQNCTTGASFAQAGGA